MSVFFGAIADDFTGATDLASMMARAGVPVTLRIGVPNTPASGTAFEVIALKIRTLPADEAVAQARAALNWLRAQGAKRIFWKYCSTFDSTAQGNIGTVADALMTDLGLSQTVYVPAFPENGRRVFMGHLFVGEQLLNESPMRDHPLTPMRQSHLQKVLEPQVRRPTGQITAPTIDDGADAVRTALKALQKASDAHIIMDTTCEAHLATIAEAVADMDLVTGGSAIAAHLVRCYQAVGAVQATGQAATPTDLPQGQLVLSGSCSQMTRTQVARYLEGAAGFRLDPLELAREGAGAALSWLRAQDPAAPKIIYATAEPASVAQAQEKLGVTRAGNLVEDALAQLAYLAVELGIGRIVVAGGETSGAVTRALDIDELRLGPEIAPGVPWVFTHSDARPLALALKSGNFGGPTFFAEAFDRLGR